jgi:hypothetical protein
LLVEDETLYQSAKRLYSSRNKIVHWGGLVESESSAPFPQDEAGAMAALKAAIALFSWLGERANFPLPDVDFISHED